MKTYDIDDIKMTNHSAGLHFFEPAAMRFFDSRCGRTVYQGPGGVYFVTSEQFHGSNGYSDGRKYTVRQFDPKTGKVETAKSANCKFNEMTHAVAVGVAKDLAGGYWPVPKKAGREYGITARRQVWVKGERK